MTKMRAPSLLSLLLLTINAPVYAQQAPLELPGEPFDLVKVIAEGAPMTAQQAAERAALNSPSMQRAEALSRLSEAAVARGRVQLLPRLELSARYTHIDGFPDGKITPGGSVDPEMVAAARALASSIADPASRTLWLNSLDRSPQTVSIKIPRDQVGFAARLSYPVSDLFFAVLPGLAAAESAARANKAQVEAREARVRLSARESFYQLARARGSLAVAQRAVEQARVQQDRIEAGVKAGMRPHTDALSAAARVASAEQAVASAEASVDVTDAALRTMLADADGAPYGIAEPILDQELTGDVPLTAELLARAQGRRAELRALREGIDAQRGSARSQKASGYPHLAVYAGGDYANPNRYQIPPTARFTPSWEVGATLTYVPNDTLTAARRDRENSAQLDALDADLAELTRSLSLEVRQARALLVRSVRSIEAARAAQTAAQDAYDRRMVELRAGEVTIADLFISENDLNAARLSMLDAAVEQQLAKARLAYAVGD